LLGGCDALFGLETTAVPAADASSCGSPDEDGDCIADVDDNCPGIANPQQTMTGESTTASGAGDACDPDPTRTGNAIAFFDGFVDAVASDAAWANQFGGGWTITDGLAINTATGDMGYLRHVPVNDEADLAVEARFVFHAMAGTADPRLGALVDFSQTAGGGQECWIDPQSQRLLAQETANGAGGDTKSANISPLADGDDIVLVFRRDRGDMTLHCAATINGARVTVPIVTATGTWQTMEHVAIQASEVVADLGHVTLYTR
jgi:hypothetical protein